MINVILVRHGQTAWNADNNRYCGRTDIPLTEHGIKQAEDLKKQLAGISIDGVYASPLQRACTTARLATGRDPVTDQRLIEADFGNWERKTKEEFIQENATLWENWMRDPASYRAGGTGETGMEVVSRVDAFFKELIQHHQSGTFLVAAHNGVNRLYLAYKLGMPLKNYRQLVQHNSTITQFTLDKSGTLTLEHLNVKWK